MRSVKLLSRMPTQPSAPEPDGHWRPPRDALVMAQEDSRVAVALVDENAYWNSAERRMMFIRLRFNEASRLRREARRRMREISCSATGAT